MGSRQFGTLRGAARIQAEFKRLRRAVEKGELLGVTSVDLLEDRLDVWRIHVSAFDGDVTAGAQLNRDLASLEAAHGPDAAHVVLEARFPSDYPAEPFFLRVVRPRMAPYSGHVTAGGSICIQALTTGPEDGCWRPTLCVESVLAPVLFNMLNAEAVHVTTAVAGGLAGPLRIAMGPGVLQEYAEGEAKAAFARMVANHQKIGWAVPAAPSAGAGRPGRTAPAGRAGVGAGGAAAPQLQLPPAKGGPRPSTQRGSSSGRPSSALGRAASQPFVAGGAVLGTRQPRQCATGAAALPPAIPGGAIAATAAGNGPQPRKRPASATAQVIDLLTDSEDENSGKVNESAGRGASAGGAKRRPPGHGRLLAVSGRGQAGGSASGGMHSQGVPAAAAAPAAAPRAGSTRPSAASGMAVDIDLTGDDDAAAAEQPAQRRSRSRGTGRGTGRVGMPAEPAGPAVAAEPAEPAESSLAERLEAANRQHGLDLRPPPAHWHVTDALLDGKLVLVELPLSGQPSNDVNSGQADEGKVAALLLNGLTRSQAVEALAASGGSVRKAELWFIAKQSGGGAGGSAGADPRAMAELRANGLSEQDAAAALAACGGRVDEAFLYYLETMPDGGPAAVSRRSGAAAAAGPAATAAQRGRAQQERERREAARRAELAAQRQHEMAEAEEVLAAFERGGVARSRVRRIERVQQLDLLSQYQRRLARIAKDVGQGQANERRLFHGADQETLTAICTEGFDHRVSNLHGSLGAGTYFAEQSSYSEAYSRMIKHSAAARPVAAALAPLMGMAAPPILAPLIGMAAPAIPGGISSSAQPAGGSSRAGRRRVKADAPPAAAPPPAASAGHTGRRSGDASPRFLSGGLAMLYCSVALGRQCLGNSSLRRPVPGTHSAAGAGYHAVYDNDQAYPTHIIHFTNGF